jgi:hypothetical protein
MRVEQHLAQRDPQWENLGAPSTGGVNARALAFRRGFESR